jgi:hypothetical protein
MNPKKNKKLCPHCEGEIDKDALYCLYCGADLGSNLTLTPKDEIPQPLYRSMHQESYEESAIDDDKQEESALNFSMPVILSATLLIVFGLFLLIFSTDGTLTLTWDASFWFVYLLVGFPLLAFGWKLLKKETEG